MDAVALLTGRRGSLSRWLTLLTLAALISTLGDRVVSPVVRAQGLPASDGFALDAGDLRFIFRQIQIAQAHSAGGQLFGPGLNQVNEVRLPFGLRTVDGSFNHLTPGQNAFGGADQLFPRLTAPVFRPAETPAGVDPDGPAGPLEVGVPTLYDSDSSVYDSQPRIISNLIVDQTASNPAAAVAAGPGGEFVDTDGDGMQGPGEPFFIPNIAPDVGLSAPFNVMFTFFGQFFDHGLDLVNKGGNGIVFVPLRPGDPLFVQGSPTNFMVLTRATQAGNETRDGTNQTTPFVDQNQTYTSHPSHQAFLREYTLVGGRPRSTGKMIDGETIAGNIGNWGEVKAQALNMLGVTLSDQDVFNVPVMVTDPYGYLRRTLNGLPMMLLADGVTTQECTPAAPCIAANAAKTGHAFLDDIAHAANPSNPGYDAALLNAHFVTGDGRGNENIALTAVHTIFHAEHNRLRDKIHLLINGPDGVPGGPLGLLTNAEATAWGALHTASGWDYGERLFQAARFVTEMQYQHLVFEEFGRKLVPAINEFIGDGINFQSDTNPAIFAEFAHQTYRLGHSMLTETISRMRPDGTTYDIPLLDGFLNPREFNRDPDNPTVTLTAAQAAGAIFQGGTRQVANEIDEFVTDAVRNNLLGLPLDLAVLNLARGRSEGVPPLNEVRRQLYRATSDSALLPYRSWDDFGLGIKHFESLVNFVAAYGTHPTITSAATLAAKRDAAELLVNGGVGAPADTLDFMHSLNAWANTAPGPDGVTITGVDSIDLWVGGLAEKIAPFGSMLGSTFNYVFEIQLENLQNADRFYYLERLDGLNLLNQMENNSFSALIMRNVGAVGLGGDVFGRPDFVFNIGQLGTPGVNPVTDDPTTFDVDESTLQDLRWVPNGDGTFTLRYTGAAHVIWNGTATGDRIRSSEGDDTLRGDDGNDILEGGDGNDSHIGGNGDDIIVDTFGEDNIKGGPGNDAISGGRGPFDLILGGDGHDFIVGGPDVTESFGGPGNDVIYSGAGPTEMFGGAGNDWIEGGPQLDLLVGDENNQFQNDPNQGHDVITGGKGDDDYDSEGGDDVMIADVLGTERLEGMLGWDYVTYRGDPLPVDADMNIRVVLPPNLDELRDRFDLAEALSGWNQNDILRGDDRIIDDLNGDTNQDGIPGDHALTTAGIALFNDPAGGPNSLNALLNAFLGPGGSGCVETPLDNPATRFCVGNILLGGLGNDIIEGRGGDDLIDGDFWLNAQLRVQNAAVGLRLVDSLRTLEADVFARRINPGEIQIVRSIVSSGSAGIDIARFSGPRADYTITGPNAAGIVTVTDNVGLDGVDRLRNVEQLQFPIDNGPDGVPRSGDEENFLTVSTGNNAPTGAPALSQPLPQEGEALTVTIGTIQDLDGIAAAPPASFQWQQAPAAAGPFADIAGATVATFTPQQAQVNQVLRAIYSFTDGGGRRESVPSAPSGVVGDLFQGTAANDVFNGTAGRDNASGAGGNDTLTTLDAADTVAGNAGNDTLNTGAGNDIANGGAGDDVINTGAGNDSIRFNAAEGFDAVNGGDGVDEIRAQAVDAVIGLSSLAAVETIIATVAGVDITGSEAANTFNFSAVTLTNIDRILGNGGADVITGSAVADRIDGGAGADTLNGGAGADELNGEGGIDTINGDAGVDVITGGAGNDILAGGAGNDNINGNADNDVITGGAGNDTMNPGATLGNDEFRFAAGFGADVITGFGATQDATVGQDLLNLSALGITAANFATRVTIAASGTANTLITVRNADNTVAGTITLNGVLPGALSAGPGGDFVLAP